MVLFFIKKSKDNIFGEFIMDKIPVGILGATGMVGQTYISLLNGHPWFEVAYVAASARSAGQTYEQAVAGRTHLSAGFSGAVKKLIVQDASAVGIAAKAAASGGLSFVFSALEMDKDEIIKLEDAYAAAGIPVVSNASANRWTPDVPMLIAEINPGHADIIPAHRQGRGWGKGFIAVKPNCSIQSYMTPLWALMQQGYEIKRMVVNTMQAVSGAGYPGVPSLDMIDNIVPYIGGEEEKTELEPLKIFGSVEGGIIKNAEWPRIRAHFRALPQDLHLPTAPLRPIIVRDEPNRPQPAKDRNADKAMAVTVGRLRSCPVFDIRFTGLSHNTVRGAAGGGILNAELLKAKGYIS